MNSSNFHRLLLVTQPFQTDSCPAKIKNLQLSPDFQLEYVCKIIFTHVGSIKLQQKSILGENTVFYLSFSREEK